MPDLERNKRVVVDYYQTAFSGDPDAADGPEAFIGFVRWLRGEYPNLRLEIKRAGAASPPGQACRQPGFSAQ